jgi:hypothetical protein
MNKILQSMILLIACFWISTATAEIDPYTGVEYGVDRIVDIREVNNGLEIDVEQYLHQEYWHSGTFLHDDRYHWFQTRIELDDLDYGRFYAKWTFRIEKPYVEALLSWDLWKLGDELYFYISADGGRHTNYKYTPILTGNKVMNIRLGKSVEAKLIKTELMPDDGCFSRN